MQLRFILLLSSLLLAAPAQSQTFSPDRIRSDVAFLSDDLLEGRDAGTRGYDLAARWVAARFEALGLRPGTPSGWYQRVPFVIAKPVPGKPSAITINGRRLVHASEALIAANPLHSNLDESAEAVFVGYGLEDSKYKLDDYRGLDVRGKIAVVLWGAPDDLPSEIAATLSNRKAELVASKGAIGMVTILTPSVLDRVPWNRHIAFNSTPRMRWVKSDGQPFLETPSLRLEAMLSPAATTELLEGTGQSWDSLRQQLAIKGARPRGFALKGRLRYERYSQVDRTTSSNVLGLLPGSDPRLASEMVMLTAHLDHLGQLPAKNGDTVANGALDNAAGVATMLEAARAFTESGKRPKRSILFVALTAEEDGLLGSQYLAEHPTLPGHDTIANVNLDMPLLTYDFEDVVAFGAEHSTMGEIVASAAAQIGIRVSPDPIPAEGMFTRSDHFSFVRKGIPAVFLATGHGGPGSKAAAEYRSNHYHQVSDELELPIDWAAGAKFAHVNFLIAEALANSSKRPLWYSGNYFGGRFAKDQPKAPRP